MNISAKNILGNKVISDIHKANVVTGSNATKEKSTKSATSTVKNVTLNISSEGMLKASHHTSEAPAVINPDDEPGASYLRDLEKVLNSARNGEQLSKEEQSFLNDELKNMTNTQYKKMLEYRLPPDAYKKMQELQKHFQQRQQMFQDLLKEVNAQELQNDAASDMLFMNEQIEAKEKEDMVELLKESLDQKDEETDTEEIDDSSESEAEDNELSSDAELSFEEETKMHDEKKAADLISSNKESIKNMHAQKDMENANVRQYDKLLNQLYESTKATYADEKMSSEDKVKAYDFFKEMSSDLAHAREIERTKARFDAESAIFSKIMLQSHNDLSEVLKKFNSYKPKLLDKETVMQLLK